MNKEIITKQRLLDLGFIEKSENLTHSLMPKLEAYKHVFKEGYGIVLVGFHSLPHIKFVHELKDLYYSLTGEEILDSRIAN